MFPLAATIVALLIVWAVAGDATVVMVVLGIAVIVCARKTYNRWQYRRWKTGRWR